MKKLWAAPILFAASQAAAGGWEASKLDTSFMYQEGGFTEFSYGSLDYNVKANTTNNGATLGVTGHKTAKSQTRPAFSLKMGFGDFDFGVSSFKSGSIQMQGGAGKIIDPEINFGAGAAAAPTATQPAGATFVPDADATLNTMSFIGKYNVSENFGVIIGASQNTLAKTKITTILGTYDVKAKSAMGSIMGVVYSQPDIAMRVELLVQPKSTIKAESSYTEATGGNGGVNTITSADEWMAAAGGVSSDTSFTTTASRPETITLNFQSGIAADTLLYGSIHKAAWKSAQITAATDSAYTTITSSFTDTTALSLGVARKINDQLALTASFSSEDGGGKTSKSLFTQSNGSQGVSLGARYTVDNITISGGYNYTNVGNVTVTDSTGAVQQAVYKNNSVSALGFKIGFSF
jgi:long-chain fatty acid transport protein